MSCKRFQDAFALYACKSNNSLCMASMLVAIAETVFASRSMDCSVVCPELGLSTGTPTGEPLDGTLDCGGPGIDTCSATLARVAFADGVCGGTRAAGHFAPVGGGCFTPHLLHILLGFQDEFTLSAD